MDVASEQWQGHAPIPKPSRRPPGGLPALPRDPLVVGPDDPALVPHEFGIAAVGHRVRAAPERAQLSTAVVAILVGLTRRVADDHVHHDVVRLDADGDQAAQPAEQNALVAELVPGRVQPPLAHVVGAVVDARDRRRGLVAEHANVDALREAHPEPAGADLGNAIPPLGAAEEVVVEQEQVARPRVAAPESARWCGGSWPGPPWPGRRRSHSETDSRAG